MIPTHTAPLNKRCFNVCMSVTSDQSQCMTLILNIHIFLNDYFKSKNVKCC